MSNEGKEEKLANDESNGKLVGTEKLDKVKAGAEAGAADGAGAGAADGAGAGAADRAGAGAADGAGAGAADGAGADDIFNFLIVF